MCSKTYRTRTAKINSLYQTLFNHKEHLSHKRRIMPWHRLRVKELVSCVKSKTNHIPLLLLKDHWTQVVLSREEVSTANPVSLASTLSSQIFRKCRPKIKRGSLLRHLWQRHHQRNLLQILDHHPIWFNPHLRDSSSHSQRPTLEPDSYPDHSPICLKRA